MSEEINPKRVGWRTSLKERLSYYFGFGGIVGESAIVANFLSTFILLSGIDLRISAIIILVIKGIDAVDDVLFGFIVDKIKFNANGKLAKILGKGNYLPWIRLVFLMLPIAAIFLYNMPSGLSSVSKIIWFAVGYLVWDLFYTIIDVPMNAIVTTMTDNVDERNVLISRRMFPQLAFVLLVTTVGNVMISEQLGVPIGLTVIILSAFMLITIVPIALGVREHNPRIEKEAEEKYTFKAMLKYLKGNKPLSTLFGGYIVQGCLATGAGVSLFVGYYLFNNSLFSLIYTAVGTVPIVIIMILVPILAKKFDKFKMMFLMAILSAVTGAIVFFVGYGNAALHVGAVILHAVPAATAGVLINFLCPDCVEYGLYKTGIDGTGITFAIQTFAIKMTGAIASSFGILILGLFGWVSVEAASFAELQALGVTQTAEALRGLWIVNSALPVLGTILCVLVWIGYKLKDKDVAIMTQCNSGLITREEAEAALSRKY